MLKSLQKECFSIILKLLRKCTLYRPMGLAVGYNNGSEGVSTVSSWQFKKEGPILTRISLNDYSILPRAP